MYIQISNKNGTFQDCLFLKCKNLKNRGNAYYCIHKNVTIYQQLQTKGAQKC